VQGAAQTVRGVVAPQLGCGQVGGCLGGGHSHAFRMIGVESGGSTKIDRNWKVVFD
jgi:hypothetical protein